jgi:WD40 repeat protein
LNQLAFASDGQTLAGAISGEVRIWDATTGDLKQTLKPRSGTVWSIAFSPENRLLAGYGTAPLARIRVGRLTLWDVRSGAIVRSLDAGEADGAAAPGTLAFSPDGKSLASAGVGVANGQMSIGDRNVGFGNRLINNIKLWNVATAALLWTSPDGDRGPVTSLGFSPDGLSLYCCDSSATSRIDARTGQTRKDLMKATNRQPR